MLVDLRAVLLVLHLVAMVFMAAPLYMLIVVNERARFGVPVTFYTDRYMENVIRQQPIRCYVYLTTIFATGLALMYTDGWPVASLFLNWALLAKVVAVLVLVGLLSYVHFGLQPKIEGLLAEVTPEGPAPSHVGPKLTALRRTRKRLSATCLFVVLTAVAMGLRLLVGYSPFLAVALVALAALFARRAYVAPIPYGWV